MTKTDNLPFERETAERPNTLSFSYNLKISSCLKCISKFHPARNLVLNKSEVNFNFPLKIAFRPPEFWGWECGPCSSTWYTEPEQYHAYLCPPPPLWPWPVSLSPWFGVGTPGPGALFCSLQKKRVLVWRCELLKARHTRANMIPRLCSCFPEVWRKSDDIQYWEKCTVVLN